MIDTLSPACKHLKCDSIDDMTRKLRKEYGYKNIIYISVFNKRGNFASYAAMTDRGDDLIMTEHMVAFAGHDVNSSWKLLNSTRFAMSVLYLYGAESLTASMWRWWLANEYYQNDIMYSHYDNITKNAISRVTAFYLGWTDEAPRLVYEGNW